MRAWFKHIYRDTDLGFRLLFPWVRLRDYLGEGRWRSDRTAIARQFELTFGRPLDWEQPRTLNEKMQWLKRYYREPLQRVAADKVAVREHVRARVGSDVLIPLLAVYRRAADIRFDELPAAFALKVNHGSGQNWIVRDKAHVDERRVRRQFREWMAISHYAESREWPYRGIKPLIVAEELLVDDHGQIPSDYKLHCFGGQVACIQVDLERDTDHRRNFYDTQWQQLPFIWSEWDGDRPLWPTGREVPRPALLPEMIRLAEALSADFPYVRIDLFHCHNKLYFGEITFFHGGGFERFEPADYDQNLGDRLVLPKK
ncbi:MAG: ATP-grasp fold amidoligase family protein [Kiritimatiellia bacterium]|jgi:hypothetical protein|nr:ATP-grasp fold amidoligase family protein [Kiritimatiellia bacterium]